MAKANSYNTNIEMMQSPDGKIARRPKTAEEARRLYKEGWKYSSSVNKKRGIGVKKGILR